MNVLLSLPASHLLTIKDKGSRGEKEVQTMEGDQRARGEEEVRRSQELWATWGRCASAEYKEGSVGLD